MILLMHVFFVFMTVSACAIETGEIDPLMPKGENIISVEQLEGGASNHIWKVIGQKGIYVFRQEKAISNFHHFKKVVRISQLAGLYGLSPEIIGSNENKGQILLEYIENEEWPDFNLNPQPYFDTILAIKQFHTIMNDHFEMSDKLNFPFSYIVREGSELILKEENPTKLADAIGIISLIYQKLKSYLEEYGVICHGDFHHKNILLYEDDGKLKPMIIDFDSFVEGDPLLDIVKFCIHQPIEVKEKLFKTYLGKYSLTDQEKEHFDFIELSFLMVVAINRLKSAVGEPRLTRAEMDDLLESDADQQLPSFLTIPFEDQTAIARQKGAVYALAEFLRRAKR